MRPDGIREEDFRYHRVSAKVLKEEADKITEKLKKCMKIAKIKVEDVQINYLMIYRIIERIDQRRDYYMYFHSQGQHVTFMSQTKEMALLCYWLVKYKPLSLNKKFDNLDLFLKGYTINDVCAAYLLSGFIAGLNEKNKYFFSQKKIDKIIYSLANRDISKESLIMYIEAFTKG